MAGNLLEYLLAVLLQCHQVMLHLQWDQVTMLHLQWDQVTMHHLQWDQVTMLHLQWDQVTMLHLLLDQLTELLQYTINLIMVNLPTTSHHQITILIILLHLNQPIQIPLLKPQ